MRRPAPGARHRQLVEAAENFLVARGETPRDLAVEDEQVGDQPRLDRIAIDPAIRSQRRDGAQDRRPLEIVEAAADLLAARQQQVIFDVEQPRGVVGAFDRAAEHDEPIGIAPQHRPVRRAVERQHRRLDRFEHRRELVAIVEPGAIALDVEPRAVDRLPPLERQRGADGARVRPRRFEAAADRRRIGRIDGQELADAELVDRATVRLIGIGHPRRFERRFPRIGHAAIRRRQRRQPERRLDQPRQEIGALDVAADPIEVAGGAREHLARPPRQSRVVGRALPAGRRRVSPRAARDHGVVAALRSAALSIHRPPTCPWSRRPATS